MLGLLATEEMQLAAVYETSLAQINHFPNHFRKAYQMFFFYDPAED